MSACKTRRWTPAQIRAATAFPKPSPKSGGARWPAALDSEERAALRTIAETADLIDAGEGSYSGLPRFWLLVPAPASLLDALAEFEAERADREPDTDREKDDCDHEDNGDDEPDSDTEGDAAGPRPPQDRFMHPKEAPPPLFSTYRDGYGNLVPYRVLDPAPNLAVVSVAK